jgi:hypothetical protein
MENSIKKLALVMANSQINVREKTGNNDGPDVEKYLALVGLGKGNSWCMAFVFWCVNEAAKFYALANPLVKTAGVLHQYETTTCLKTATPAPGDIFIMDFGGGEGHTGFVTAINGDTISTIEGNTNNAGCIVALMSIPAALLRVRNEYRNGKNNIKNQ